MDKIKEIEKEMLEKLNVETLDRDATLATYGLDSLDVVEFILDIEDNYNISFDADETKDIKTIGSLLDLVEKKLK